LEFRRVLFRSSQALLSLTRRTQRPDRLPPLARRRRHVVMHVVVTSPDSRRHTDAASHLSMCRRPPGAPRGAVAPPRRHAVRHVVLVPSDPGIPMRRPRIAAACRAALATAGLTGGGTQQKDGAPSGARSQGAAKGADREKEPFPGLSGGEIAERALKATTGAESLRMQGDMPDEESGGTLHID